MSTGIILGFIIRGNTGRDGIPFTPFSNPSLALEYDYFSI